LLLLIVSWFAAVFCAVIGLIRHERRPAISAILLSMLFGIIGFAVFFGIFAC
jgi:hypothetical protein